MSRALLAVAVAALCVVPAGVAIADDSQQRRGFAHVFTGDIVIGEGEQRIEQMRVAGYDETVDELVVEIDLTATETHGVDVTDVAVELNDNDVDGASVESASVDDGVVRLVLIPEDDSIFVDTFRLTGLNTTRAEEVTDVAYDVEFSAGEGEARPFDVVDPDAVTARLEPRNLFTDRGTQSIRIEDLQPAGDTVTVEIDVSSVEEHGVSVDALRALAESEEATVRETTVENGVVTVTLSPDEGVELFDVRIDLEGFEAPGVEGEGRSVARDVAYDVRIEGDVDETVEVETFHVATHTPTPVHDATPTPVRGDGTPTAPGTLTGAASGTTPDSGTATPVSGTGPGFGPVLAVLALVGFGALLGWRR